MLRRHLGSLLYRVGWRFAVYFLCGWSGFLIVQCFCLV